MATENPRVAAYPPQRIYERLLEFKRQQGFKSDSAAIVAILEAYFFSSTPDESLSEPSALSKRVESLEMKVTSLLEEVAHLKQASKNSGKNGTLITPPPPRYGLQKRAGFIASTVRDESNTSNEEACPFLSSPVVAPEAPNVANALLTRTPNRKSDGSKQSKQEGSVFSSFHASAMSQSKMAFGEPPWSESKVDGATSEPNSESLTADMNRNVTGNRESSHQNAYTNACEPRSESLLARDGELELNTLTRSELPDRTQPTLRESDAQKISCRESETMFPASELPSQSLITRSESKSVAKPLERKNMTVVGELLSKSQESTPNLEIEVDVPTEETTDTHSPMELPRQIPNNLTGAGLARRLGVSGGSISRNKTKDHFGQWTSQHDPDGITWHFDGQTFRSSTG